jgi:hypothetical protein
MGRYAPAFFSERCLIGAAKRGRSDCPSSSGERQMGEEERGKAPPIWGAEGKRDIEAIEEVGNIGGSHIKLNKEQRWR